MTFSTYSLIFFYDITVGPRRLGVYRVYRVGRICFTRTIDGGQALVRNRVDRLQWNVMLINCIQ